MTKSFKPRPYQTTAGAFMLRNPHAGLFLDMGLGKTVVSLLVVNRLINRDFAARSALVIAPKKVAESVWAQEAAEWRETQHLRVSRVLGSEKQRQAALRAEADLYVINRENVVWLCAQYGGELPFDIVIIDESSSFKNERAKRTRALTKATERTPYLYLLTGTPTPNGLVNLWAQVNLLDRGERLGRRVSEYRERYFSGRLINNTFTRYRLRPGAAEEILARVSDICISMQGRDLLDLPPITYNNVRVDLDEAARRRYEELERDLITEIKDVEITAMNAASLTTKLLQLANGAIYYDDPETGERRWAEVHRAKIERLSEIIEEQEDRGGVLVAYAFQHDRDRLLALVPGARELRTDKDIRAWNEGQIRCALVHPASAGHGLNLQHGGFTAVWFGLTWDLELYQQFNKRLHRPGQQHPVVIHHLIATGTEDPRVLRALSEKGDVQQALMDGLRAKIEKYKTIFN